MTSEDGIATEAAGSEGHLLASFASFGLYGLRQAKAGDPDITGFAVFIKKQEGRLRLFPRLTDLKTGQVFLSLPQREWSGIERFAEGLSLSLGLDVAFTRIDTVINVIVECSKDTTIDLGTPVVELREASGELKTDVLALFGLEEELDFWKRVHEGFGELQQHLQEFFFAAHEPTQEHETIARLLDIWDPTNRDEHRNPILGQIAVVRTGLLRQMSYRGKLTPPSDEKFNAIESSVSSRCREAYADAIEAQHRCVELLTDKGAGYRTTLSSIDREMKKKFKNIDLEKLRGNQFQLGRL
ncbi:MAG: hypothetical protein IH898_05670 [Planctomycetes bacterium]|nr:hypothetical protein [Planctomycetota bacterium]